MEIIVKNYSLLIDEEDVWLADINWTPVKSNGNIYFQNRNVGWLHKVLINCPKGKVSDHINGNTLDNRKVNLRICTKLQNQYNQKKHKRATHSQYKGVTFRKELKSKPWEAFIYNGGKGRRLGYFATEIEAAQAYNKAAKKAYGEYARLNNV